MNNFFRWGYLFKTISSLFEKKNLKHNKNNLLLNILQMKNMRKIPALEIIFQVVSFLFSQSSVIYALSEIVEQRSFSMHQQRHSLVLIGYALESLEVLKGKQTLRMHSKR